MQSKQWLLGLIFISALTFSTGCNDDDGPEGPEPPEIITDLTFTLTPTAGGTAITLNFMDPDGDGGIAPTLSVSGPLAANTTYNGSIELLNTSVTPSDDITAEVREEADEHQFFFATNGGLNLSFAYTDMDADGRPLGLTTSFQTGDASTGNFQIILRHEPDKAAAGVADGDITNAGGETDIEVVFGLEIQ